MIRSPALLRQIEAHKKVQEDAFWHLKRTFDDACKDFPEIMEPHLNRSAGIDGRAEILEFMRSALRETVNQRYPLGKRKGAA